MNHTISDPCHFQRQLPGGRQTASQQALHSPWHLNLFISKSLETENLTRSVRRSLPLVGLREVSTTSNQWGEEFRPSLRRVLRGKQKRRLWYANPKEPKKRGEKKTKKIRWNSYLFFQSFCGCQLAIFSRCISIVFCSLNTPLNRIRTLDPLIPVPTSEDPTMRTRAERREEKMRKRRKKKQKKNYPNPKYCFPCHTCRLCWDCAASSRAKLDTS